MIPFLKSVANACSARYRDLSDVLFLFPNKRAGTFFLKYLGESVAGRRAVVSPPVLPVADFVQKVSGRVVADRFTLLFELFKVYREELTSYASSEGKVALPEGFNDESARDFDRFIAWGETVLRDFNEIDSYLADPDEIFKNVRDYREISSTFLSEEQKRVMNEYFGRDECLEDVREFWRKFNIPEDRSNLKNRFIYLWQMLAPLYRRLNDALAAKGLSTTGGSYRLALEAIKNNCPLPWKKIVAVGFNALSTAEVAIYRALSMRKAEEEYDNYIDFFWDGTGPVLEGSLNSASEFLSVNRLNFPQPEWAADEMAKSDCTMMPEVISVAASPSNTAQTKIIGRYVSELRSRLPGSDFKEAKVAVVLPDESLLLPLLYSLPEEVGDINLTMGYSLRLTPVVSFVNLLRRVYYNRRMKNGVMAYYHRDLRRLLGHPLAVSYIGKETVEKIMGHLNKYHKFVMTVDELRTFSEDTAVLLAPVPEDGLMALAHLDRILMRVSVNLAEGNATLIKQRLDSDYISAYRDSLARLSDLVVEHGMKLTSRGAFMLADRLVAAQRVTFEGEPLSGLQVMGTLETRALDFDCIVIPSMNERIMPMKARSRTFIPDSLRKGYGLPPSNYAESLFAYYFYRMISRAKEVRMIYDARNSGGMRSGDVSRYVLQLRHLFAKGHLQEEKWSFSLGKVSGNVRPIEKTDVVMRHVEGLLEDGDDRMSLSATSLNNYRKCQVKFFYQNVMRIRCEEEAGEYIDAITQGNIVHSMMEQMYVSSACRKRLLTEPVLIDKKNIERLLDDEKGLEDMMRRTVNRLHFHLPEDENDTPLAGEAEIVAGYLLEQVKDILRYDLTLAPFRIYGVEITEKMVIELPDGKRVSFSFAIDRLDSIIRDGVETLRIVDYKTGSINMEANSMQELFISEKSSKEIFQLFTYAWLLGKKSGSWPSGAADVMTEIYRVGKMVPGEPNIPVFGKDKVWSFEEYGKDFDENIKTLLMEIFDRSKLFVPTSDPGACRFCDFARICGR